MNDGMDLLKYMEVQVNETSYATYLEFINEYQNGNFKYFCFLEGADDEKYYQLRLNTYLNNGDIRCYDSRGKKNVLDLYDKLKKDENYKDLKLLFFVDKDYDFYLEENFKPSLFVTPCYSIENLYSNVDTFEKILNAEFHLAKGSEFFTIYKDKMEKMLDESNNLIIEYNSLGLLKNREKIPNGTLSLSHFETKCLLKNHDGEIIKNEKYEKTINAMYECIQFNKTLVEECKNLLISRNDFINDFRGKNQLDIFVKITAELQQVESRRIQNENARILNENKLKKEKELRENTMSSVKLNITSNRISELSQYAKTPNCLIEFLKEHA